MFVYNGFFCLFSFIEVYHITPYHIAPTEIIPTWALFQGLSLRGAVWCGVLWCGIVSCDVSVVSCDMVRCSVVWCRVFHRSAIVSIATNSLRLFRQPSALPQALPTHNPSPPFPSFSLSILLSPSLSLSLLSSSPMGRFSVSVTCVYVVCVHVCGVSRCACCVDAFIVLCVCLCVFVIENVTFCCLPLQAHLLRMRSNI